MQTPTPYESYLFWYNCYLNTGSGVYWFYAEPTYNGDRGRIEAYPIGTEFTLRANAQSSDSAISIPYIDLTFKVSEYTTPNPYTGNYEQMWFDLVSAVDNNGTPLYNFSLDLDWRWQKAHSLITPPPAGDWIMGDLITFCYESRDELVRKIDTFLSSLQDIDKRNIKALAMTIYGSGAIKDMSATKLLTDTKLPFVISTTGAGEYGNITSVAPSGEYGDLGKNPAIRERSFLYRSLYFAYNCIYFKASILWIASLKESGYILDPVDSSSIQYEYDSSHPFQSNIESWLGNDIGIILWRDTSGNFHLSRSVRDVYYAARTFEYGFAEIYPNTCRAKEISKELYFYDGQSDNLFDIDGIGTLTKRNHISAGWLIVDTATLSAITASNITIDNSDISATVSEIERVVCTYDPDRTIWSDGNWSRDWLRNLTGLEMLHAITDAFVKYESFLPPIKHEKAVKQVELKEAEALGNKEDAARIREEIKELDEKISDIEYALDTVEDGHDDIYEKVYFAALRAMKPCDVNPLTDYELKAKYTLPQFSKKRTPIPENRFIHEDLTAVRMGKSVLNNERRCLLPTEDSLSGRVFRVRRLKDVSDSLIYLLFPFNFAIIGLWHKGKYDLLRDDIEAPEINEKTLVSFYKKEEGNKVNNGELIRIGK